MKKRTVSVIVPVYNSEKYLNKCVDSILNQTYKDFQVILVDDGSTDASVVICDEYAQKDERVTVIHKKNEGLVRARKTGVAHSNSEYVSFVDADDWIDICMYQKLVLYAEKYSCDMVCSGVYRQFENYGVLNKNSVQKGFYEREELLTKVYPYMLYDGNFFNMGIRPNMVAKLFKKDILEKLQQDAPDDVTNGEDVMLTYPALLNSKSVFLTDEAWYYYRQHPESMSQTKAENSEKISILHLYNFMKNECDKVFSKDSNDNRCFKQQLHFYMSHLLLLREPKEFDSVPGQLRIFGDFSVMDKIVIYGAGRFGKQIYYYAINNNRETMWIDKNSTLYKNQGFPVCSVEEVKNIYFDKILIAVMDLKMAKEIRGELNRAGIADEKILSLDIDYISDKKILERMGYK